VPVRPRKIPHSTYRALAAFRYHIREYLDFSDRAARSAGLEPKQYQLLLAIKGLPPGERPTVGVIAQQLHLRHHSTVELINRAETRKLVRRRRLSETRTFVEVEITAKGEKLLAKAVALRLKEIRAAGPVLASVLTALGKAWK
jgi:DNA-binding MarR family transcriptional regulator